MTYSSREGSADWALLARFQPLRTQFQAAATVISYLVVEILHQVPRLHAWPQEIENNGKCNKPENRASQAVFTQLFSTFQLKIIQDTNKNFERPLSFISSNQKNIFGAEFSLDKEISAI